MQTRLLPARANVILKLVAFPSCCNSPQDRSAQHEEIYGQIAGYLSDVDEIFVDDGAVGSFRGCELGIRLVSDDAALALYAKNMHVRTSLVVCCFFHELAQSFSTYRASSVSLSDKT